MIMLDAEGITAYLKKNKGERRLMKLAFAHPKGYPVYVLLTEEEGKILSEDDCPYGRKGKYYKIPRKSKMQRSGGSDTYERT